MVKNSKLVEIPSDHAAIWMIGCITVSWSRVEDLLEQILEAYFLNHPLRGEILESVGNETKTDFVFKMLLMKDRKSDFVQFCANLRKALLVCRDNRNFLAHGIVHKRGEDFIHIERYTKKKTSRITYKITLQQLNILQYDLAEIIRGLGYVANNNAFFRSVSGVKKREPLPDIQLKPRRLAEILQPVRRTRRRLPPPLSV
jgi:hypothetical protein